MDWLTTAQYCYEVYGAPTNFEEEWFECPECGEIVYADDWDEDEELANGCCPICGQRLVGKE